MKMSHGQKALRFGKRLCVVGALFGLSWWAAADRDGDGYIEYLGFGSDCNDGAFGDWQNPGMPEICNYADDNCNGQIDEGHAAAKKTYYDDFDGDGYGRTDTAEEVCPQRISQNSSRSLKGGDCDDSQRTGKEIHPGAKEVCDGKDNNCDGKVDESGTRLACVLEDRDHDGFKTSYCQPVDSCIELPKGKLWEDQVRIAREDCNDDRKAVHPGALEICDEIDNDCDNEIDEGVQRVFYFDFDGDGYGDNNAGTMDACAAPEGYAKVAGDCDDTNSQVHIGCLGQPK